ncbi:hypothetical protein HID58_013652 [Brassica napus]|uniref:Uncharacterized protein n=1 Tax=Brassica napus TaxID=3708 RepID=A0ABQ8E794_BRANA|nr:hypothetical protein HID58_013652 [Brassica napus]
MNVLAMDEQCLVLSGDWVCVEGGKWDFVIEKHHMGRMVQIYEGIGCSKLEGNVLHFELATGIRTPPVLITSDGAIRYFCQHLKVKGWMNLFAKFEPNRWLWTLMLWMILGWDLYHRMLRSYSSSAASNRKVISLSDDNDFVREVEKVEDIIKGNTSKGESSNDGVKIGCSVEIYDGGIVAADLNEIGLSPKGYCKNFWDPLIAGDFGGSNVVNVVFNEDKIVEGLSKKKGPPTYFCNTGSYFNYFVEEKRHKKLRSQRIIILG